jgi:hypothetical protein
MERQNVVSELLHEYFRSNPHVLDGIRRYPFRKQEQEPNSNLFLASPDLSLNF